MNKICINASNLHVGGGVQVAASFIYELSMKAQPTSNFTICCSSKVDKVLREIGTNFEVFKSYNVIDMYGLSALTSPVNRLINGADVCFTIFGPNYLRVKAKTEIVGFAQAWMLDFDNPISQDMSPFSRLALRFKFYLQWLFFKRSDHFLVELNHVRDALIEKKGLKSDNISTVYNCVSSLYLDKSKWSPASFSLQEDKLSIGIVSRDYPHKNIGRLSEVAGILEKMYNLRVHFYVTLNNQEWNNRDAEFKQYVSTVGELSPEQCPIFYEKLDGVIFPSLLECFSATPLEAMVMGKPLFASDRRFVRDVCAEHAFYFDPLNSRDIAKCIANYFDNQNEESKKSKLLQAKEHALNFSNATGRADKYLKIINQQIEGKKNAI